MPIAILVLALGFVFLPRKKVRRTASIDWKGLTVLLLGLPFLHLSVSEGEPWGWVNWLTIGTGAGGALLLFVFVLIEAEQERPLVRGRSGVCGDDDGGEGRIPGVGPIEGRGPDGFRIRSERLFAPRHDRRVAESGWWAW